VVNPLQIAEFVRLLHQLGEGRELVVALEPSGTYGDALRQALRDAQIAVQRISPKAAHDYAEVFDGVPSQHDGKDAAVVAELAALRAQLSYERGGLNSTALFIDGGNCSDPYLFASFARQHGLDPRKALRRIVTCRAFTMYQLADIASRHLVRAAEENASRLVVVADLLGTFDEAGLDRREASRVLEAVKAGLDELLSREIYVLCTLVSQNGLAELVTPWADSLVELSSREEMVRATLLKGKAKAARSCEFKMPDLLRSAIARAVTR